MLRTTVSKCPPCPPSAFFVDAASCRPELDGGCTRGLVKISISSVPCARVRPTHVPHRQLPQPCCAPGGLAAKRTAAQARRRLGGARPRSTSASLPPRCRHHPSERQRHGSAIICVSREARPPNAPPASLVQQRLQHLQSAQEQLAPAAIAAPSGWSCCPQRQRSASATAEASAPRRP